jgi:hypothetical protein
LTELTLNSNQIGAQEAEHLADALKQNKVMPHALILSLTHYFM